MKTLESQLQQSCIRIFRYKYQRYAGRLFAIPNGGKRSKITAAILKAEGVLPGVPDLFLSVPVKNYAGMFIEMKAGSNSLTEHQQAFFKEHSKDYYCVVVRSIDEFLLSVGRYLDPATVITSPDTDLKPLKVKK